MEVFYRKHLASSHGALFNALVYTAIWARGCLLAGLGLIRALMPKRRVVKVKD
jgi:hypothetical protein